MAATRDFFGGFENDSLGTLTTANGWVQNGSHAFGTVVDASTDGVTGPRTGTRMVRFNHEGGLVYEAAQTPQISYTNEIFYRVWLRRDENHDGGVGPDIGAKYMRFFINSGDFWIDKFIANHNTETGLWNSGQFGHSTDSQNTYSGGASGDNTDSSAFWQRVEFYFNTTTGACKIWNTGTGARVLVTNVSGRDCGGLKADSMAMVSNGTTMSGSNYMYMDDIEIFSDSGTGEATTGSMSDASIEVAAGGTGSTTIAFDLGDGSLGRTGRGGMRVL